MGSATAISRQQGKANAGQMETARQIEGLGVESAAWRLGTP